MLRISSSSRRILLAGVSALTLMTFIQPVQAGRSVQGRANVTAPAAAAAAAAGQQQAVASQASRRSQALLQRALKSYKDRGDLQALKRAQALAGGNQIIVNGALVTLGNGLYDATTNPTGGLKPAVGTATPTGDISVTTPGGANPIPVPSVPEGSSVWIGADLPTQQVANGHYDVTVKQNQQKAILTWESFDIGKDTTLTFDQKGNADWIALNRVMDPNLAPSKILGNIKADGQVYVINRNGIIFGGSSQVNVHTLVASSLNLSNAQFAAGIATPLYGFQNGGDHWGMPTFGDHGMEVPNSKPITDPAQVAPIDVLGPPPGDVEVREGALIQTKSGGKAMLFAPHVANAGTIKVPDGQVILAAGENVWLTPTKVDPQSQGVDASFRGLDVAVSAASPYLMSGAVLRYALRLSETYYGNQFYVSARNEILPAMLARAESVGYSAVNDGVIETEHGNITMQALNVTQNGTLYASTGLNNRDGSIILRAWGQGGLIFGDSSGTLWAQAGTLTIGADSNTMVMPDLSDTGTMEQSSVASRYKAGSIELRGKMIDIKTAANLVVPSGTISVLASTDTRASQTSGASIQNPTNDGSRLYVAEDALLSVAGITDVLLAMESNVVKAEFRINELRDSPLYRDSWLRGASVYIDKRKSGSFADGPMAGVEWGSGTQGQWVGTAMGDMSAWVDTGTTTLAELSTTGGVIQLKSGGDVIIRKGASLDVSGGSVTYAGGIIKTTKLVRADGQIVDIGDATPDQLYIGIANGTTTVSTRWGTVESYGGRTSNRSQGVYEAGYVEGRDAGSITIYTGAGLVMEGDIAGGVTTSDHQVATGNVAKGGSFTIGSNSNEDRGWLVSNLIITSTPQLLADGFTSASALPTAFFDPSNGAISGKTTWIDAKTLNESGLGTINLNYYNTFELAEGTALDLAPGTSFTAAANNSSITGVSATVNGSIRAAGGTIRIVGGEAVTLGDHARLDASGQTVNDYSNAARVVAPVVKGGSVTVGVLDGGVIHAEDGAVLDVSGGLWLSDRKGTPKTIIGDAGTIGLGAISNADLGHLDLRAFAAGSGGSLTLTTAAGTDIQLGGTDPGVANVLYLPDNLYGDRGFRSVSVDAMGDIVVPDGAKVTQIPVGVDLTGGPIAGFETGTAITDIGTVRVLEARYRVDRKPTSLSLRGKDRAITIGAGATLTTDMGGSIALGQAGLPAGTVTVNGIISAPAGSIAINANTIVLGDAGKLEARGVPVIAVDPVTGWRVGKVLAGGSVSLEAQSKLDMAQSAVIDVSGTAGIIDVANGRSVSAVTLASDGGTIEIGLPGQTDLDTILLAKAGGSGAVGGILTLADRSSSGGAQPVAQITTRIGYYDQNGVFKYITYNADLDLYDEFGTDALKLTSAERNAINKLVFAQPGGIVVVDGISDTPITVGQKPWDVNTSIRENVVTLLNKYFYATVNISGKYVADFKINIPDVATTFSQISSGSISGGGFSIVNLNTNASLGLANGVNLNLPQATLNLSAQKIVSVSDNAVARIHAALISLNGNGSSVPAMSETSSGALTLDAAVINVGKASIRGFATTQLVANDIILSGVDSKDTRDTAGLDADGHLILKAGAVYPGTAVTATIRAGDKITVEPNGTTGLPLSAGGDLILEAPEIVQNGTLLAPFGSITLKSTDSTSGKVTLGAGSVTSVSGAGLVLPYGNLRNGEEWIAPDATYDNTTNQSVATTAPPEKRITLDAASIDQADGAVVDIRGGGDLTAWEHVPGPGGSHDVLAMNGVYAILPSQAVSASTGGKRVWLAGGNGLAAGWYTLLPAHYALLPGAYAVQMVSGTAGNAVVGAAPQSDGSVLMAGKAGNAFSGAADQLASTWRVMNGAVVRRYSEYNEANANAFFSSDAFKLTQYRLTGQNVVTPRLPMDGGSVVYKAVSSLIMDGLLKSAAASGGRGGMVDIAASKIVIAGAGHDVGDLSGYLVLDAARLSGFGAESLLLGGVRSGTSQGTAINVVADSVVVRNDETSALVGPEVILAAKNEVLVADGSVLRAQGDLASGGDLIMKPASPEVWNDNGTTWTTDDDYLQSPARDWGALIRLSNGAAVGVVRTNIDTTTGGLVAIGAGAVLDGGNALMIDATRSTTMAASAQTVARDITLGGGRIGFGGGSEGLVFDAASLVRFSAAENLTLRSHTSIDFYTGLDFGSTGLKSLTLDAAGLVGRTADAVVITGDAVTLKNSGGTLADPGVVDQASLTIDANRFTLGSGAKMLHGFTDVTLNGHSAIVGSGSGSLDAGAANLTLSSPILSGHSAANQNVNTSGTLSVVSSGTTPAGRDTGSLGSVWSLAGKSVTFGGRIDAIGGAVTLTASNGDVTIADGARIDVGGMAKPFHDVAEYVDAGSVSLTAVGGDVRVVAGSVLNLAAASGGGDAGTLSAAASGGGAVVLDGTIDAHAAKGKGGRFTLDIAALPDFAGFSQRLGDAGFSTSRSFRIRSGDVIVDGTTSVEDFTLVADAGKVTITGSVTAAKAYGGSITVTGGNGVVMRSGALLRASSTTDLGGGRLLVDAGQGNLDFAGGTIDVGGGEGGRVRFRADRTNVAGSVLNASITGASSKVLEGIKVYTSADGTVDSLWANAVAEANTFMTGASPINGVDVMAGIEIRSTGDLVLNSDIDLSTMVGHQGGLTLRAAGDLIVNGNISDGFDRADRAGMLLDQASWDIRLAAGADLTSLDLLAVRPQSALAAGKGSLIVGKRGAGDVTTGYLVRTGTGDLSVAAGRDLELIDGDSVLYTAGRKAAAIADFDPVDRWLVSGGTDYNGGDVQKREAAVYGDKGGNLAILVGGAVKTNVPSNEGQLFTEWLWRVGRTDAQGYFRDFVENGSTVKGQQTSWWVEHRYFRYGVGALGGGNVTLKAGGDVNDLVVAMPTNAQVSGGRFEGDSAKTLWLRGGGALEVDVGGSILGGQYYIGRGDADISAGALGEGRTLDVTLGSDRLKASYSLAPVLALGDARMTVSSNGDLTIQTVVDPLLVDLPYDNWNLSFAEQEGIGYSSEREAMNKNPPSRWQTRPGGMTDETALSLVSVGGDVSFGRQVGYLRRGWDDSANGTYGQNSKNLLGYWVAQTGGGANLFPTNTRVVALNGSINGGQITTMSVGHSTYRGGVMTILPSASSGLQLLAADSVTLGTVVMGTNKPTGYATPFAPNGYRDSSTIQGLGYGSQLTDNPEHLLQENDYEPSRIYALDGSVNDGRVFASEQLWVRAGRDVRKVSLRLRNLHSSDVSWVEAGNDIISGTSVGSYTSLGYYLGGMFYDPSANTPPAGGIIVQGPGSLLMTAGRDVYGQEYFVYSTGNRYFGENNQPKGVQHPDIAGLPSQGADIEIIAGLAGKQPDYAAFSAAYLDPAQVAAMPDYLKITVGGNEVPLYLTDEYDAVRGGKQTRVGLVSFIESVTGDKDLTPDQAWQKFQALPELAQQSFLRQVYMQELRASGRDQAEGAAAGGYVRGYTAIATLFPGDGWKGDVQVGNALFRTMSGGDIRVMVPGGGLQVAALGTTVKNDYGLVTLGYGRIDLFTKDSVTVNRSRILTFGGGDEIIWATNGDIDAGRGAKTSRVPSAPEIKISADGVTSIVEKADMSGSGIGTIEGYVGVEPGDVDLIAPMGTVDAGDAGVRVSGNLNLAAYNVLNANNFDVKGEVKGVPKGETSTPTVSVEGGDEGQQTAAEAAREASRQTGPRGNDLPSIITVEVIGYGGGDASGEPDAKRKGGDRHGYNPNSAVQFSGLTEH